MALLRFNATDVARLIAHATSCTRFMNKWDGVVTKPDLILMIDQGVSLMSNGIDRALFEDAGVRNPLATHVYAQGLNPYRDADWFCQREAVFQDFTGHAHLTILDDAQTMIDRGDAMVVLSADAHSATIFDPCTTPLRIGETYRTPSGLGGAFQVALLAVDETHATVQNCGNGAEFDQMLPYRVSLDKVHLLQTRRAA